MDFFKNIISKIIGTANKYIPGGNIVKAKQGVTAFETANKPATSIGYSIQEWNRMPFQQKVEMVQNNNNETQLSGKGITSPLPSAPSPTLVLNKPPEMPLPFYQSMEKLFRPRIKEPVKQIAKPLPTATRTPTPIQKKPSTFEDFLSRMQLNPKVQAVDIGNPGLTWNTQKPTVAPPIPTPTPDPRSSWRNFADMVIRDAPKKGFNGETIVRQLANESGFGKSNFAKDRYNFGGIGAVNSNPNNAYSFKSPEEFLQYYMDMIERRWPNAYKLRGGDAKAYLEALQNEVLPDGSIRKYAVPGDTYVNDILNTRLYND